jgi:hypothetical protein
LREGSSRGAAPIDAAVRTDDPLQRNSYTLINENLWKCQTYIEYAIKKQELEHVVGGDTITTRLVDEEETIQSLPTRTPSPISSRSTTATLEHSESYKRKLTQNIELDDTTEHHIHKRASPLSKREGMQPPSWDPPPDF